MLGPLMKVGVNAYVSYQKSDNPPQRLIFVKLQKSVCNVFEKFAMYLKMFVIPLQKAQ